MTDRKTIMSWLEGLAEPNWRLFHSDSEVQNIAKETLGLLKSQEAVEPIYIKNSYTHLPVSYCSKCREPIDKYITGNQCKKTEYCYYCGQAVKWDA